ncbi:hypothetical protein F7D09_0700 [Bifidobacterium leontopitheci]|uniref:Uncharacterized protein n=1 Tax=Bifidobacterium leontopitheci TaxID=2650774 RepID=A0A6I1GGK4_9BIFI|nr:hypothetical protein F7D09_0700 [Bifidobacterium leontopitheci]
MCNHRRVAAHSIRSGDLNKTYDRGIIDGNQ